MKKQSSDGKLVRFAAGDIPAATPADLLRLRAAADSPVDTSEIPEWTGGGRAVLRDAQGRLVKPKIGPIAQAILNQLDSLQMTRYRLWQIARAYCPTLSESAVYGFLGGTRQIEVRFAEALIMAAGLEPPRSKKTPPRVAVKKTTATPARKITPATAKKPEASGKAGKKSLA